MKKEKLSELQEGDAVAIMYGFDYLKVIIIGNTGSHITWYSNQWLKDSSRVSSYSEMNEMKWTHIGKWKTRFLLQKKLIYLNNKV